MSVYTNRVEYAPGHVGHGKFRLWADTEDELWFAALEAGAETDQFHDTGSFPCFFLTPDQQSLAIYNGATMSDYLGPREWRARRERDPSTLKWIEAARYRLAEHMRLVGEIRGRRA